MKKLKEACLEFVYFAMDHVAFTVSVVTLIGISASIEFIYYYGIKMILSAIGYGLLSALATCGLISVIGAIGYIGKREEDKAAINEASKNETENI